MKSPADETTAGPCEHAVQFYDHDHELASSVGGYLADGLRDGAVAIVIATPEHRSAFELELAAAGIDTGAALANGKLVSLDAAATLARFSDGERVDPDAYRAVIGGLVAECLERGHVCAYGEMVSLLWEEGSVLAAIELEKLWNGLARELPFTLLCAYRSAAISDPAHADAALAVRDLHTNVIEPEHQREARLDLAPEAPAPASARGFVADVLREHGYADRAVEDAQLVISELATNAVVHARSALTVRVLPGRGSVRLSIDDTSEAAPVRRRRDPAAQSGRGLWIVGTLAERWGVEYRDGAKTVWAELR